MTSSSIGKIGLWYACLLLLTLSVCRTGTADTVGRGPTLVFLQAAFTFDPVVEGTVVTHTFTAVNQGTQTVRVNRVKTD